MEKALELNGKKFPPLLPRPLRVTRAKNAKNLTSKKKSEGSNRKKIALSDSSYSHPSDNNTKSMDGRARRLLGRAGAAKARSDAAGESRPKAKTSSSSSKKRAESFRMKKRVKQVSV